MKMEKFIGVKTFIRGLGEFLIDYGVFLVLILVLVVNLDSKIQQIEEFETAYEKLQTKLVNEMTDKISCSYKLDSIRNLLEIKKE
ncbi:MAG: hypothetical protein DLD55_02975 [candidate division SR1 bacterium]|nr:MAG: hypothetical protein DLD55_02975 [candidate division SR1 bacterium]